MRKSVLVVEDEYLIALDLQLMLESHGWQVLGPVPSVQDALRLLDEERPTVALLDVNLGGELVTPVAEALAARGVPFALASAHHRPQDFGGAILADVPNAGKPTNERRVLAVLRELVGL